MIAHGVNVGFQNFGSPLNQKQEISSTARCPETVFYIIKFYDLMNQLHYYLSEFCDTLRRYFFLVALRPNAGHGLLIHKVSRSHTTTHHSR